jgi:hypothetical protein
LIEPAKDRSTARRAFGDWKKACDTAIAMATVCQTVAMYSVKKSGGDGVKIFQQDFDS